MRSSPLSLDAESVFPYDLQHELDVDLNRLRKNACEDGDIVFILPEQVSIWAHSPLFYVASNNTLPTVFGTEAGTAVNDRGTHVKMLFLTKEKKAEFEEVMGRCYTRENLMLLWKAIGGDKVRFEVNNEQQHMEMDTSQVNSALPASMLPDFEIHLREIGRELITEPSSFSIKVHRFLLDNRIPYYKAKANNGQRFKDATPMASNLSRVAFTEFSLWSVAMYIYCGIPSIIFNLDPNLQDYIAEPNIRDSRSKRNSHCTELRNEKRLPAEGIELGLLEIARAANFLLVPELENWAHFQLYRLAHRFECTGSGCAEIIPYIIDAVYRNDITDEWIFNKGMSWFAKYENIPHLWKWSLLYNSRVVPLLVEKIIVTDWENSLDEEEAPKRGENAVELFVRLWKLKQYTSMTDDSDKWEKELIEPLMENAAEVLVDDLKNPITFIRLETFLTGLSFSKLAGEDLLAMIINKACAKGSNMKDWDAVEKLLELCDKEEAYSEQRAKSQTANLEEVPKEDQQSNGKMTLGKKPMDTRLKASAAPFIPGKVIVPPGASRNLGNSLDNYSEPVQTTLSLNRRHLEKGNHFQENNGRFESQDVGWPESDQPFRATVGQARWQGLNMRRMMSHTEY